MNLRKPVLPILIALFTFASLAQSQSSDNSTSTQRRNLTGFKSISFNIPADVVIAQGDFHVDISCSASLQEKIETEVHGGELEIKFDNWHVTTHEPIAIHISMPTLEGVEINGSGSANSQSNFSGNNLRLEINGSGKLNLSNLSFNEIRTEINGSGHVENLSGTASVAKFEINGSGKIDAENFTAKEADASVTGSGNIRLAASEVLNADITGSGNIR